MYLKNLIKIATVRGKQIFVDPRSRQEVVNLITRDIPSGECKFSSPIPNPRIIDAGAHIGVMTTYFKTQYPDSTIVAFEPNPSSFAKLVDNIEGNGFRSVTPINAALAHYDGTAALFGASDDETRGNSISQTWGMRNEHSTQMQTRTTKLSHYLREPCEFLKLDVEGEEFNVLNECARYLYNVREIELEVHITADTRFSVYNIEHILLSAGFQITMKKTRDISKTLPEKWDSWTSKAAPTLTVIRAFNSSYDSRQARKP